MRFSFKELRIQFSWGRARHEYLSLTVEESYRYLVVGSDIYAIARVELVAELLTRLVGVVGNFTHSCHFVVVGKSDEYIAASESVERVVAPTLNVGVVPDLVSFSHCHKGLNIGVKGIVRVQGSPEGLTIGGIVTALETLLWSVVNNGDTLVVSNKGESRFEQRNTVCNT